MIGTNADFEDMCEANGLHARTVPQRVASVLAFLRRSFRSRGGVPRGHFGRPHCCGLSSATVCWVHGRQRGVREGWYVQNGKVVAGVIRIHGQAGLCSDGRSLTYPALPSLRSSVDTLRSLCESARKSGRWHSLRLRFPMANAVKLKIACKDEEKSENGVKISEEYC